MINLLSMQTRKCASEKSTLVLKPRGDVTRSPKQGSKPSIQKNYQSNEGWNFPKVNKVFRGQLKQSKKDGLDVTTSKTSTEKLDLKKLYTEYFLPGLAAGNTEVLQHKVFFDLLYHTGRRGKEGLRALKKFSFKIKTRSNGHCYVKITFNEVTKNEGATVLSTMDALHNNHAIINEQPADDLCPVSSFENYLQLTAKNYWLFWKAKQEMYWAWQDMVRQKPIGWHDEDY